MTFYNKRYKMGSREIEKNVSGALITVYKLIADEDVLWILTGSTSLRIQGVDVPIHDDIDILTDKTGAYTIDKLLAEYRVKAPKHSATDQYQSYYGVYKINDVQVEIMGEFQYRLKDGSWSKPNHTSPILWQEYKGIKLPMLSLEQELIEYENLGRKDTADKI